MKNYGVKTLIGACVSAVALFLMASPAQSFNLTSNSPPALALDGMKIINFTPERALAGLTPTNNNDALIAISGRTSVQSNRDSRRTVREIREPHSIISLLVIGAIGGILAKVPRGKTETS